MSEPISLFITFLAIAIAYEFLKPKNTQSVDNENDSSNADD